MLAVGDTKKISIRFIHYESNVIRLERMVEMKEFEVATVYCTSTSEYGAHSKITERDPTGSEI
jgi:hypothetical protein